MFRFEMSRAGSVTEEGEKRGRKREEVETKQSGGNFKDPFKDDFSREREKYTTYMLQKVNETKGQRVRETFPPYLPVCVCVLV